MRMNDIREYKIFSHTDWYYRQNFPCLTVKKIVAFTLTSYARFQTYRIGMPPALTCFVIN